MKLLKSYQHLSYVILFAALALSFIAYGISPKILTNASFINWAALLLGFFIILSPWGSIRLITATNKQKPLPVWHWLSKIILLEFSVLMLYVGMGQFSHFLSGVKTAFSPALSHPLMTTGLFPWASVAIFAVCFGVIAFIQQKDCYLDTISVGLYKRQSEAVNVSIKGIGRAFTLATFAVTSGMATLAIASLISNVDYIRAISGLNLAAFGAAIILFLLTFRKTGSHLLLAAQAQRPALGFILSMIIWAIFLALYGLFAHDHNSIKPTVPTWLASLFTANTWQLHWKIFTASWWFMLTPMLAISIARFSYGYSLRAMISATLLLPAIIALASFGPLSKIAFHAPAWLAAASIIGGFILLLALILNKNTLPLFAQTYLAKNNDIKHRNENIFAERWKRVCGLFFYLFVPGGIVILSFLYMSLTIAAAILVLAVLVNTILLLRNVKHTQAKPTT